MSSRSVSGNSSWSPSPNVLSAPRTMPTRPSSSAADGCSAPTRRFALVTRSPTCSLTLSVMGIASLAFSLSLSRAIPRSLTPLASAAERQGSGGPSGLQNRQAGAALRLDGSIPSPLRPSADKGVLEPQTRPLGPREDLGREAKRPRVGEVNAVGAHDLPVDDRRAPAVGWAHAVVDAHHVHLPPEGRRRAPDEPPRDSGDDLVGAVPRSGASGQRGPRALEGRSGGRLKHEDDLRPGARQPAKNARQAVGDEPGVPRVAGSKHLPPGCPYVDEHPVVGYEPYVWIDLRGHVAQHEPRG